MELVWTDCDKVFTYTVEAGADKIVLESLKVNGEKLFCCQNGQIDFKQHDKTDNVLQELKIRCFDAKSNNQVKTLVAVKEMVQRLGVSSSYLSGIELGRFAVSTKFFAKLFKAFDIPSDQLPGYKTDAEHNQAKIATVEPC